MEALIVNFSYITWQMVVMWAIGGLLIYLAIAKDMEPTLLLPMQIPQVESLMTGCLLCTRVDREDSLNLITFNKIKNLIDTHHSCTCCRSI